jgi:F-type H+-transporting ATPase subunit b
MEQLLQAFGVDVKLIIIQILNFVVLMGALSYFLYKPVLGILKAREEKIAQGIEDAEAAARSKASADEEKKQILSVAHKDAEVVATNAKTFADQKATEILAEAQVKAQGVIQNAEVKGENIKIQAQKESEAEIAKLAILAAEKVLRG